MQPSANWILFCLLIFFNLSLLEVSLHYVVIIYTSQNVGGTNTTNSSINAGRLSCAAFPSMYLSVMFLTSYRSRLEVTNFLQVLSTEICARSVSSNSHGKTLVSQELLPMFYYRRIALYRWGILKKISKSIFPKEGSLFPYPYHIPP